MRKYNLYCSVFATTGSLIYGYDSGIISTTLGQKAFPAYFNHPSDNLTGAIVSTYSGGQGIGNLVGGYLGDKLGRKRTIWLASALALVGAILQTTAVNIPMFLVGRILAGFAIGLVYAVASIYNAEIAPPKIRGVMVAMQTLLISAGYALSNWVGVFGSFADGNASWRIPLGIQCVPAVVLIVGLFWLPESPRWLLQRGRDAEAWVIVKRLHEDESGDSTFAEREFNQMKQQIEYEREVTIKSWTQMFTKPSNRRRLILGILLQVFLQTTGVNVVNYYQTQIFGQIGIQGRNVLWVSAGFGMVGVISTAICLTYIDKTGRKKPLAWTSVALTIDMILLMVFSKYYAQNSTNKIGQGFTIAWIFIFSFIFSLGYNPIQLVYIAEIFPTALRSRATAICAFMGTGTGLLFNQLSPKAFAHISWRYYAVFVVCDAIAALAFFTIYPETKGKTLEEIAEIFGDDVAFTEYIGAAGNATTVAQKKIEVEPEANVHQIEHSIEKK